MPNCGHCAKQPITIHVAECVEREGETVWDVQHLCDNCATMLGLTHAKSLDAVAMLHFQPVPVPAIKDITCSQCTHKMSDFRRTGRLGCEKCYESFGTQLKEILEKAQAGRTAHVGRAPGMTGEEASRREDLASLNRRLKKAIEREAYEEAAAVRDQIRQIEAGGAVES
ncbi:MAG: UvrB/UvrC motif-containing protein [Planctomycetota bacterium]